jgi:FkbM family methyltransferase
MKFKLKLRHDEICADMILDRFKGYRTPILERLQRSPFKILTQIVEKITANKRSFFSIYGEDAIIMGLMDRYTMETGKQLELSYIDIGAWRPIKGSNTYFLYKKGFSGTVIEPNPHFVRMWKAIRPKDRYFAIGCGIEKNAELRIFHPSAASNTFSAKFAREIIDSQPHQVTQTLMVPLRSLNEIITDHASTFKLPFLLDIDIEGMDFEVVSSYDFPVGFRPIIILIEDKPPVGESTDSLLIQNFLTTKRYKLVARTVVTAVYIDEFSQLA